MRLPAGYVARPATWDDLDAVVEVFKACDLADVGFTDPVRDHLEYDWRMANYELERDSKVVLDGNAVVAYGTVGGLNPSLSIETFGRVHPEHRGRGLGAAIVRWTEEHALDVWPSVPVIRNSAPSTDSAANQILERAGYASVRTFWHMTRDLRGGVGPVSDPAGVVLRDYDHATDVRTAFDALEEAFVDHWESEPYPYQQHERDMGETDPRLVAVALDGSEVVGVAMSRTIEGEGWVDVIGVRSKWRRRGVARALLVRVFAALAEAGAASASLNVDAENITGATRVYESAGMHVRRAWALYEKRFGDG